MHGDVRQRDGAGLANSRSSGAGGLAAAAVSTSQINLAWNAFTNATSYNVKRSLTNGGPYAVVASGVTATNYQDTGLAAGTMYYYVVSAVVSGTEQLEQRASRRRPRCRPPWDRWSIATASARPAAPTFADSVGGPVWTGTLPNGGTLSSGQLALSSAVINNMRACRPASWVP